MRADYDSEADALSIVLRRFERYDDQEEVDDDYCVVGIVGGDAVSMGLLYPTRHLDLLELAAKRYDLDGTALVAAARGPCRAGSGGRARGRDSDRCKWWL